DHNTGTYFFVQVISEIIETARSHDFTDVIFVSENRGKPDGLIVSHLAFGPTAYFQLLNVVTRHEIQTKKEMGKMSEQYPHLIFEHFTTQMGKRVMNILKHIIPAPKLDAKRIVTFSNESDYISFRNHVYDKGEGGPKSIELKEIGPQFEVRLYQVKLGTLEQDEAEVEWVLRPYMNTAKKRQFLGE
uniref:Brix domain-containing protein n=1 Tax=Brassica oleracea var. oleracea TaxID=109376 RepID=A0A0D3E4J2_BRAOL